MCLLVMYMYFLKKVCLSSLSLFNCLVLPLLSCKNSSYILRISFYIYSKYFLSLYRLYGYFLIMLWYTKFLKFILSSIYFLLLLFMHLVSNQVTHWQIQDHNLLLFFFFFLFFLFQHLRVLVFILRSLIHFEIIFYIWSVVNIQLYSFTCGYLIVSVHFVSETILSLLNGLGTLSKINWPYMYEFISELSITTFLWSICLSVSPPIFIFQVYFSYSGFLAFSYEFKDWLFHICNKQNIIGIQIRITMNP